jgi:hypothetical protein
VQLLPPPATRSPALASALELMIALVMIGINCVRLNPPPILCDSLSMLHF